MSKNIYILLTKTGTSFSKFLSFMSGIEYPHVSISLSKDCREFYSFGRKVLYFPLIAGFVEERPNAGVYEKYKNTSCMAFELPVTDLQHEKILELLRRFRSDREIYRYNFLGLLAVALDIPFSRKRHFLCSQFVAYLLDRSKAVDFGKDFSLVTARDFYDLKKAKLIFSGRLSNYPA